MTHGELIGALERENGAGSADRMADGDTAAVDVHLIMVEAEVAHDRVGLTREGLVDLEKVDVGKVDAELVGKLLAGVVRRVTHERSLETRNGVAADRDHWGAAELLRLGAGHDDHGGRGVVQA